MQTSELQYVYNQAVAAANNTDSNIFDSIKKGLTNLSEKYTNNADADVDDDSSQRKIKELVEVMKNANENDIWNGDTSDYVLNEIIKKIKS